MTGRIFPLARQVPRLCGALSTVLLLGMAALLLADVTGRAFGHPLFGAQDLAEMAMVVMTFGGIVFLEKQDGQIRVDLLKPVMPSWMITLGDRIAALIAAALYGALAWAVWDSAALSSLLNLASNILTLPKAPVQYGGAGLAAVAGGVALLRALAPARKDRA